MLCFKRNKKNKKKSNKRGSFESEFEKLNFSERLKRCADEEVIETSKKVNDHGSDTATFVELEPEHEKTDFAEERLKRYVDEVIISSSDTLTTDEHRIMT